MNTHTYYIGVNGETVIRADGDVNEAYKAFYAKVEEEKAKGNNGWITLNVSTKMSAAWNNGTFY